LLEKSKIAQHVYKEGHKICWNELKVLQIEWNTAYRKYKESAHVSDRPSDQSSRLEHLSHMDSGYHSISQKTTTLSSVEWVEELVLLVLVPLRSKASYVCSF
jgi:hypothetical protein